jgi:hypothetical protein
LYLKQEWYGLRTQDGVNLIDHVNAFNRVVSGLACIEVKVEDKDKASLMLTLLPKSYKGLVVTLAYGKTSITSSKVQTALLSYDQREKKNAEEAASASASGGQGLMVGNNHGGKSGKKKKGEPQCFNCE